MLGSLIAGGASLLGGLLGRDDASDAAAKNARMQKEFAQQGIRWKVADAKAAGIHPLAALGAQTTSFAPVNVGAGSHIATGLSSMGQDISRGIEATRTNSERMDAYTKTIQDLNIQRMGLENDLLSSQIAKIHQAGIPPAMPTAGNRLLIEGQGNSPLINSNPQQRTISAPEAGSQEPGAITDTGYARTPTGWAPVMSKDVKDRLEEDFLGMLAWNVRNRLAPSFDAHGGNPPAIGGPYIYYPTSQEYRKAPTARPRYGIPRYYR